MVFVPLSSPNDACSIGSIKSPAALRAPWNTSPARARAAKAGPLAKPGRPKCSHLWSSRSTGGRARSVTATGRLVGLPRLTHQLEFRTPNPNPGPAPRLLCTAPSSAPLVVLPLVFLIHRQGVPMLGGRRIHSFTSFLSSFRGSTQCQAPFQALGHHSEQAGRLPSCLTFQWGETRENTRT